jgi:hypothetical protein
MAGPGRRRRGATARRPAFAEFVRNALHAAVDQLEPQADALESIRARIGARSRPRGAGDKPILNP